MNSSEPFTVPLATEGLKEVKFHFKLLLMTFTDTTSETYAQRGGGTMTRIESWQLPVVGHDCQGVGTAVGAVGCRRPSVLYR